MYVDEHGGIEGSITGGCVEGAVAAAALEMIEADGEPQLVTYGISDELAGTVGLMCGGIVHIFIHELKGAARDAALLDLEATIEHRPAALVTLLDGEQAGREALRRRARHHRQPELRRAAGQERAPRGPGPAAGGPLEHARLRHRRRQPRLRPARLRLDPGRAAADGRLRRDRLLERARAAGQGPRLQGHDRRPALGVPEEPRASPPTPRPRSAGPTRSSTASSWARATRS